MKQRSEWTEKWTSDTAWHCRWAETSAGTAQRRQRVTVPRHLWRLCRSQTQPSSTLAANRSHRVLKELTNSNRIISSTLCGLKNLCKSVVYYASLKVCSERWLWLGKLGCHQQWPNLTVLVLELVVVIVLTDVVRSTFLSFCNLLTTFVTTKHSNFELDSIKDVYNMDARLLFMNSSTFSVESTALSDVFHKPEFSLSPTLNAYCWFAFWQSGHPFKNDWQNFGISCFSQMHLLMFEYWVSFKKCSYTIAKECFNNYETASIYAYCFLGQRVFYKI